MWLDRTVQSIYWKFMAKPHAPMTPEERGSLVLRDALPADLARLAQLHVDTFNETHVGPFGSGPTFAVREWQWREHLGKLHATNFVLVFEAPSGEFVAFAWFHATLGEAFASRLNKIYVRRSHQRQGLGESLVRSGVARLLANGVASMFLFTEVENTPACSFYEGLGGERQLGDDGKFHGKYGWPDLNVILDRLKT